MEDLNLSNFFRTKAQAQDFAARIAAISEQIYQTNFNLEQALAFQFGLRKKDAFLTLLRENTIQIGSQIALKTFLTKLHDQVMTLPILTITIAFEPSEKTLQAISEWFVLNLHKQILLDLSVNPTLVAGAAVSYKGKHLDFSIRQKFTTVLAAALTPPQAHAQKPQPTAPSTQAPPANHMLTAQPIQQPLHAPTPLPPPVTFANNTNGMHQNVHNN